MDALALKLIVDFCYTGEIIINQSNVQHLLPASNFLQVSTNRRPVCATRLSYLQLDSIKDIVSFTASSFLYDVNIFGLLITLHDHTALHASSPVIQIETVREACCKFLLSQLEPSNCLGIRSFADANCCVDLQVSRNDTPPNWKHPAFSLTIYFQAETFHRDISKSLGCPSAPY